MSTPSLINIATLREAITVIHESIAIAQEKELSGGTAPHSELMGIYLETSSKLMDACISITSAISQAQASERHLAAILGCISSSTISEAQALRATKLLRDFKHQQLLNGGYGSGKRRSSFNCKSKPRSATMEEEEDHLASLANLYDSASLWMLNYTTVQDGKKIKMNLVELKEASHCLNRMLKRETGGEEMRGCLKQLRQHVEDLATHLEPLHGQIKVLFRSLLTRRNDLLSTL